MDTKVIYSFQNNSLVLNADLSEHANQLLSSTSIYLPPREAEYFQSITKTEFNKRQIIQRLLKKYSKTLVRGYEYKLRIKKQIQSREEVKTRFSFRPTQQDWVQVQMLSLGLGMSCSMVILDLIKLEMNELLNDFLDICNAGLNKIFSSKKLLHFSYAYDREQKFLKKELVYCSDTEIYIQV